MGRRRKRDDKVATLRYGLIFRVVSTGDPASGEQAGILREVASKTCGSLVTWAFTSTTRLRIGPRGGEISLQALNEYFQAWLKEYYHERVHSAIKQEPILRFSSDTVRSEVLHSPG